MTRALILAAGFGTRLGQLSDERPKPLLPVCDMPLIRWAIALLAGHGITEIAVNLHHRGELIEAELGDGSALGVQIFYSREQSILGTGGGIRRISDWLTDGGRAPFFVVNGKILIDLDLNAVMARHRAADAAATLVLRQTADARKWGAIEADSAGRVTRILDSGTPGEHVCMFTGVHLISPRLVERLPAEGESDSIRHAYIPALLAGDRLEAHLLSSYFHEHSIPERYLQGNWNALAGRTGIRHLPGPLTGIDPTAQVADGALLSPPYRIAAGARIDRGAEVGPHVVVGAGAHVQSGARLTRVVLWPGATCASPLANAIVGTRTTVTTT